MLITLDRHVQTSFGLARHDAPSFSKMYAIKDVVLRQRIDGLEQRMGALEEGIKKMQTK